MSKGKKKRKPSKMWRGVKVAQSGPSPRRMRREHRDVLQNIEFALVQAWRDDGAIDDRTVRDALRAARAGKPPGDALARRLYDALGDVRDVREDVGDEVWAAGLRTVLDSVRLHSSLARGETSYLDFVEPFLP